MRARATVCQHVRGLDLGGRCRDCGILLKEVVKPEPKLLDLPVGKPIALTLAFGAIWAGVALQSAGIIFATLTLLACAWYWEYSTARD